MEERRDDGAGFGEIGAGRRLLHSNREITPFMNGSCY